MLGMRAEYCAPEMAPYTFHFGEYLIVRFLIEPDIFFQHSNDLEAEELQCLFQGMLCGFLL